jgi:hypothetical protein
MDVVVPFGSNGMKPSQAIEYFMHKWNFAYDSPISKIHH